MSDGRRCGGPTIALGAVLVVGVTAGAAEAQEIMYGSTDDSSGGSIVVVDQEDASYTVVGTALEGGPTPAIAMDSGGRLFVSNNDRDHPAGRVGVLREVDPADGSVIATVGIIRDGADDQLLRISSMEFSPTDGQLYGVVARDDNIEGGQGKQGSIVLIDTTTAIATVVGSTGLSRGGLAFAPDGRLYLATVEDPAGFTDPVIARIDPSTGAVIGDPVVLSLGREIEGMAIRQGDGTCFAVAADGSTLYTIDPVTGTQVAVGSASGPGGSVADLTFRPAPVQLFGGVLLPQKLRLGINTKRVDRSRLVVVALLDVCCLGGHQTGAGAVLDVNGLSWDLSDGRSNKKGTRVVFKEDGVKVVLRTGLGGTSRGALSVKLRRDLTGVAEEGGDVTIRLTSGDLDVAGTATLVGSRFDLRRGNTVTGPDVYVLSLRGRAEDPGGSTVKAKLGLASIPDGAGVPDVAISVGTFGQLLSGELAAVDGDRLTWSVPGQGVRRLVLDTARREVDVDLDDVTLGYTDGPLTIRVTVRTEESAVSVEPRVRGSSFKY